MNGRESKRSGEGLELVDSNEVTKNAENAKGMATKGPVFAEKLRRGTHEKARKREREDGVELNSKPTKCLRED